ncbi:hypothetical protein FYK55_16235 [Roseiconus nitratireducens]|uniref:Uncharacterized protein n=2 Tax=Roseiconus nitratireducens TaxID=2605748 RepID=A0A5M6D380_9BACT|nr:hypothetical protein FYK55_16235 [Roseiconus nitratireducens]
MAALSLWAASDPWFEIMLQHLQGLFVAPAATIQETMAWVGLGRLLSLLLLVTVAGGGAAVWVMALCRRAGHDRSLVSLRSLVALTGVMALWCSLFLNHSAIAWQGKRVRLALQRDRFDSIARPLRNDWPTRDGSLQHLGPYMAYPFGKPRTLILLTSPSVTGTQLCISAIERCDSGALKLQLAGPDGGDWAEWHPPSSQPGSFTGGLNEHHDLQASLELGGGWYLVRYRG